MSRVLSTLLPSTTRHIATSTSTLVPSLSRSAWSVPAIRQFHSSFFQSTAAAADAGTTTTGPSSNQAEQQKQHQQQQSSGESNIPIGGTQQQASSSSTSVGAQQQGSGTSGSSGSQLQQGGQQQQQSSLQQQQQWPLSRTSLWDPFGMLSDMAVPRAGGNMLATPFDTMFRSMLTPFYNLERNMERMFGIDHEFMGMKPFQALQQQLPRPQIEVSEEPNNYVVKVNAVTPDAKKDDFRINIRDDVLTITGKFSKESKSKRRQERSVSSFTRSMVIPDNVQMDKISAKFENNELRVILPKTEESIEEEKKTEIKIQ